MCDTDCDSGGETDIAALSGRVPSCNLSDTGSTTREILFIDPYYYIGYHIGKEPTIASTIEKGLIASKLSCIQIYVANSRSFVLPKIDLRDLQMSRHLLDQCQKNLYIHSCLLINLAGSVDPNDPQLEMKRERCIRLLSCELDIAAAISSSVDPKSTVEPASTLLDPILFKRKTAVVVHVGACKDRAIGIKNVARSIVDVLDIVTDTTTMMAKTFGDSFYKNRRLYLENSAGEGNKLGRDIQELADILKEVPVSYHDRIGICIDTAHSFGSGICDFQDVSTFFNEIDTKIGLGYLKMIHLNDSIATFKECKDRHANLGFGYIFSGEDGEMRLFRLLSECKRRGLDMIGESPGCIPEKEPLPGWWDYMYCCNVLDYGSEPLWG